MYAVGYVDKKLSIIGLMKSCSVLWFFQAKVIKLICAHFH